MTFGLVNASLSLPDWQAVKITFFAPCPKTPKLELYTKYIVLCESTA